MSAISNRTNTSSIGSRSSTVTKRQLTSPQRQSLISKRITKTTPSGQTETYAYKSQGLDLNSYLNNPNYSIEYYPNGYIKRIFQKELKVPINVDKLRDFVQYKTYSPHEILFRSDGTIENQYWNSRLLKSKSSTGNRIEYQIYPKKTIGYTAKGLLDYQTSAREVRKSSGSGYKPIYTDFYKYDEGQLIEKDKFLIDKYGSESARKEIDYAKGQITKSGIKYEKPAEYYKGVNLSELKRKDAKQAVLLGNQQDKEVRDFVTSSKELIKEEIEENIDLKNILDKAVVGQMTVEDSINLVNNSKSWDLTTNDVRNIVNHNELMKGNNYAQLQKGEPYIDYKAIPEIPKERFKEIEGGYIDYLRQQSVPEDDVVEWKFKSRDSQGNPIIEHDNRVLGFLNPKFTFNTEKLRLDEAIERRMADYHNLYAVDNNEWVPSRNIKKNQRFDLPDYFRFFTETQRLLKDQAELYKFANKESNKDKIFSLGVRGSSGLTSLFATPEMMIAPSMRGMFKTGIVGPNLKTFDAKASVKFANQFGAFNLKPSGSSFTRGSGPGITSLIPKTPFEFMFKKYVLDLGGTIINKDKREAFFKDVSGNIPEFIGYHLPIAMNYAMPTIKRAYYKVTGQTIPEVIVTRGYPKQQRSDIHSYVKPGTDIQTLHGRASGDLYAGEPKRGGTAPGLQGFYATPQTGVYGGTTFFRGGDVFLKPTSRDPTSIPNNIKNFMKKGRFLLSPINWSLKGPRWFISNNQVIIPASKDVKTFYKKVASESGIKTTLAPKTLKGSPQAEYEVFNVASQDLIKTKYDKIKIGNDVLGHPIYYVIPKSTTLTDRIKTKLNVRLNNYINYLNINDKYQKELSDWSKNKYYNMIYNRLQGSPVDNSGLQHARRIKVIGRELAKLKGIKLNTALLDAFADVHDIYKQEVYNYNFAVVLAGGVKKGYYDYVNSVKRLGASDKRRLAKLIIADTNPPHNVYNYLFRTKDIITGVRTRLNTEDKIIINADRMARFGKRADPGMIFKIPRRTAGVWKSLLRSKKGALTLSKDRKALDEIIDDSFKYMPETQWSRVQDLESAYRFFEDNVIQDFLRLRERSLRDFDPKIRKEYIERLREHAKSKIKQNKELITSDKSFLQRQRKGDLRFNLPEKQHYLPGKERNSYYKSDRDKESYPYLNYNYGKAYMTPDYKNQDYPVNYKRYPDRYGYYVKPPTKYDFVPYPDEPYPDPDYPYTDYTYPGTPREPVFTTELYKTKKVQEDKLGLQGGLGKTSSYGFKPVFLGKNNKKHDPKLTYAKRDDAIQAGMMIADNTDYEKFIIDDEIVDESELKRPIKYHHRYKFKKNRNVFQEKSAYVSDTAKEKKGKGNFDWMSLLYSNRFN